MHNFDELPFLSVPECAHIAPLIQEVAYWIYDCRLKFWESAAGNTISATGAIYAIRRKLFTTVPTGVTEFPEAIELMFAFEFQSLADRVWYHHRSRNSSGTESYRMKQEEYTPPKVWTWDRENGGEWAGVNRPVAGATHQQELPVGDASLQLYSLGTPNGIKITVMLEELLVLGKTDAAYDLHKIRIGKGEQFGSGFVALNPNSKIPVLLDLSKDPPQSVFESCAILHYLAEKFDVLFPEDTRERTECLSWLFWQESSASFLGGGFGHFYKYAPYPMEYPIDRYTMETKRQLDVLDRHLAERDYICANDYTIADIAIWSWYGRLALGDVYNAVEFLQANSYEHVLRWANAILGRDGVQRGLEAAR